MSDEIEDLVGRLLDWPYQGETMAEEAAVLIKQLIAEHDRLREALSGLLADIQDYQRANNLGGEDNHWQVIARAALKGETP